MAQKRRARKRRTPKPLSGWHAEDVKAAIRKKGTTLTELAAEYGYSESYLRGTLIRRRVHGEQIIATFLGVAPADIWPDRYAARKPSNGRARKPRPRRERRD
ncbi:MAG TPA: helix-turn-helix domain-containing protein [Rhizomicrobium sp.]|nr:helix-turn-helix domain-containing protein [Rhizomicrobium sp.]